MTKKLNIYRIDFEDNNKKYVGTQYIESPSKSVVLAYVKAGSIFNLELRKLIRIRKIKNLRSEQDKMKRDIIVRGLK